MIPDNLVHNAYLDNIGSDWVAVSANGHPIARATTEEAVRRAAPDAAHYLNASMLGERADAIDAAQAVDETVAVDGSAFDGDGDGHVGGSKPKAKKATAKK